MDWTLSVGKVYGSSSRIVCIQLYCRQTVFNVTIGLAIDNCRAVAYTYVLFTDAKLSKVDVFGLISSAIYIQGKLLAKLKQHIEVSVRQTKVCVYSVYSSSNASKL